jgi:hypothetical protein
LPQPAICRFLWFLAQHADGEVELVREKWENLTSVLTAGTHGTQDSVVPEHSANFKEKYPKFFIASYREQLII